MTKPKKKSGTRTWSGDWIVLSKNEEKALLDCLGYDCFSEDEFQEHLAHLEQDEIDEEQELYNKSRQALTNIRFYLSGYEGAVEALDNPLTASDIKNELDKPLKLAQNLFWALGAMNQSVLNSLKDTEFDRNTLECQLAHFIGRAYPRVYEANCDNRGKKTKKALQTTVNHLSFQFDNFHQFEFMTEREENCSRLAFIKKSLEIARISHPKNLQPLLYKEGEVKTFIFQV